MPAHAHNAGRLAALRRTVGAPLLALLLLAATGLVPAATQAREPAPAAQNSLEDLNTHFRALYRQRTQQVLEALPLVLVVQNHTITVVRGTQRRLYPVPLQRYNEARAVVHAVLGFHGVMSSLAHTANGAGGAPGTATPTRTAGDDIARAAQLRAFHHDLQRVRRALGDTTLTRSEKQLARQVLDMLHGASRDALTTGPVSTAWVADALRRTEAPLTALTESIGQAHVSAMQAVLGRIQADSTPEEWANVVAVVTGPMTPRRNNLETAVVASVLGSEHLGTRIFYSENIFSVDGALAYLQTLAGDRELSENVFGTPYRMWEDLFAPVSATLVEEEFYTALPK